MNEVQHSYWHQEKIDLTNILCPSKFGLTKDGFEHQTFRKGQYIFLPGEFANKIFFIMEGRVKIGAYSNSGKEITKAIIGQGEVFGELPLAGEDKRRNFAISMEKTTAFVLTVSQMKGLLKEHSPLNMFFLQLMASRMVEMEKRLESLVFKDSRTRVVEFLKELCETKGQRIGYEWVIRKFLTHQEIANLTSTSRQTVTTVLNELENKNILTYNRRRMLIRNLEALTAEAGQLLSHGK